MSFNPSGCHTTHWYDLCYSFEIPNCITGKLADNLAAAHLCLLSSSKRLLQLVPLFRLLQLFVLLVLLQAATHLMHYTCSSPKRSQHFPVTLLDEILLLKRFPTREGKERKREREKKKPVQTFRCPMGNGEAEVARAESLQRSGIWAKVTLAVLLDSVWKQNRVEEEEGKKKVLTNGAPIGRGGLNERGHPRMPWCGGERGQCVAGTPLASLMPLPSALCWKWLWHKPLQTVIKALAVVCTTPTNRLIWGSCGGPAVQRVETVGTVCHRRHQVQRPCTQVFLSSLQSVDQHQITSSKSCAADLFSY